MRHCPSCGAEGYTGVDFGQEREIRRCTSCSMTYAAEYAAPEEIYVDGYLEGQSNFGLDVTRPRFQEYIRAANARRVRFLARFMSTPGSLLDVGCGRGEFMEAARDAGWRVQGVEPVPGAAAFARENRGLDVLTATLEESGLPEREYDVVSAFHVAEHMPEPTAFLRSIARWARPGGLLVVEVPNFRSFNRLRNGPRWQMLQPLEHIGHFSPKTLGHSLELAGLELVTVRSPSYLGPPQNLEEALKDLGRPGWAAWLKPLCRARELPAHPGVRAHEPSGAGWAVIGAVEKAYDAGGVGSVVIGVARVP